MVLRYVGHEQAALADGGYRLLLASILAALMLLASLKGILLRQGLWGAFIRR